MRPSNWPLHLLKSGALALTLWLAGCNLPTPQKGEVQDDAASYYVSRNEGKFTNTENHPAISIPISKTMSLSACLRENNHSRPILNHGFRVLGGPKELALKTDADGCLVWEEDLDFSYLADENYINIKRTLVPDGYQTGKRDVDFIVNPWAGKIYSNIDSRVKDPIPETQSKLALFGRNQKDKRRLWLDWVRLNVMQERIANRQGTYTIEVSATLLHERLDQNRVRQLEPVSYAQVNGRIQIICVLSPDTKGPTRVVIAQMDNVKANVANGNKVFMNAKFTLSEFCPSTGFLLTGVSVAVPNAPELLGAFHGLYHGGPVQSLVGNNFSAPDGNFMDRFMSDKSYTVDQYLAEGRTLYRNGTGPMTAFNPENAGPVTVSSVPKPADKFFNGKVRQSGNGEDNGNGDTPDLLQKFRVEVRRLTATQYGFPQQRLKNRELFFRTQACLRLGIDQNAIRAATLKIYKLNGQVEDIATQDDGCIEWEDSIKYNHFAKECWFEREVRLVNKDYGFDERFRVQVNPWSRGGEWFKDVRWMPQGDRTARCVDRPSQILLDYYFFDYSTKRYNYSLDQYLNLNHRRQANISIKPSLYRPSFDSSTGYVAEPLPAGRYLMRYALIDQSVTDFQNAAALKERIYGVDRSIVNIREDGAIVDQLSFWITAESVISLGLLNQFVVELVPLREDAILSSSTTGEALEAFVDRENAIQTLPHVAMFQHRAEGGGLRKLDRFAGQSLVLEFEQIYKREQAASRQAMQKLAQKDVFAKENGLTLMNLNDPNPSLRFRTALANSYGTLMSRTGRENREAVPLEKMTQMLTTGQIDREMAVRLCGYIMRSLWREKLPGKSHGLLDETDKADVERRLYQLQGDCVSLYSQGVHEAFDIEFNYIVNRPALKAVERCALADNGESQCSRDISPLRVEPRNLSTHSSFTLSRANGVAREFGAETGLSLGVSKFLGISGGVGYQIGESESKAESNSNGFSVDLGLSFETLPFKIIAADAERCMMVRLNPMLFDRIENSWNFFGFSENRSPYALALHPDLTPEEQFAARKKGVLICEGKGMGRAIEFTEYYYLVRPSTPMGLIGDEKSRAAVVGLFTSMRGVNDMTAFMSQIATSKNIPSSFGPEFQSRNLDTTRLREAFLRGTRAIPGVYSSAVPLR